MNDKKRNMPYVGITGFMHADEVAFATEQARGSLLMVGVLATERTLAGLPSGKPNRYPRAEDMAGIFPERGHGTLSLLHVAVSEGMPLLETLDAASVTGGKNMEGIQLNVAFPDPAALRLWKEGREPGANYLVLQCGPAMISAADRRPRRVARAILPYVGIADAVLIDDSAGHGKPLDGAFVAACFEEIADHDWDLGIGAAGGLTGESLSRLLRDPIREFGPFSIDAEGGLRRGSGDQLDFGLVTEYLEAAREAFSQ